MDIHRLDSVFFNFLKTQGVLNKFVNNCVDNNSSFENLYKSGDKRYVFLSFQGGFTPQGYRFWCNISDKWRKLINI